MEKENVSKILIIVASIIVIAIAIIGFIFILNILDRDENKISEMPVNEENKLSIENLYQYDKENEERANSRLKAMEGKLSEGITVMSKYKTALAVLKYNEDGITKMASSSYKVSSDGKYNRIAYTYNFNNYVICFDAPTDWSAPEFYRLEVEEEIVIFYNWEEDFDIKAIVSEKDISSYKGYTETQYLQLLEDSVSSYVQNKKYDEMKDAKIESIEIEGNKYNILTYKYKPYSYSNMNVYSIIKLDGDYMYIVSILIPEEKLNSETISIRDTIIDSLEGVKIYE